MADWLLRVTPRVMAKGHLLLDGTRGRRGDRISLPARRLLRQPRHQRRYAGGAAHRVLLGGLPRQQLRVGGGHHLAAGLCQRGTVLRLAGA